MMQIRCQRCGWNFTLGRDTIGLSVAEAQADHLEYSQFVCPNCRHEVKVQVEVLRKHLPLDYVLPVPAPKPEPVSVTKVETAPVVMVQKAGPKPAMAAEAKPVEPAKAIGPAKAAKAAPSKKTTGKKSTAKKPAAAKVAAKRSAATSAKKSTVKKSK